MLKACGTEVIVTRTDLPHDHPERYVEVARSDETLVDVARRMAKLVISEMPVKSTESGAPLLMIHEVDLLQSLVSGRCTASVKKLVG